MISSKALCAAIISNEWKTPIADSLMLVSSRAHHAIL
ncbi:MAG: type II toxin-antitoxin system VapC family toxin [Chloroflexi bacterium]|nr:type II toxin-antitoxin system VapC family toxin [Chloroflexota bacterium]